MRPLTAVAASVVGAGVLAAAWNAGERPAQVAASPTGVPGPSTTGTGTRTPSPGAAASPSAQASSPSAQASSPSAPAPASPSAPQAAATRQVNGPTVSTPYGPVQVQVDLAGSRITDVVALKLTNSNRTSQAISASAAPLLRQEALSAQSAHIDGVSGATYTSQGYEQSLQAALDAAHA